MTINQWMVFTDRDGSFAAARATLQRLVSGIPAVAITSKTFAETRPLAEQVADLLAGAVVGLGAGYLLVFGILAMFVPSRASRYLLSFASSGRVHVLELTIRLVAGTAFVWNAHRMKYSGVFQAFGWVLIVTTLGLALLPWRWHQRFAERSVPNALRFLRPIGLVAASAGIAVAWALATTP